MSEKIALIGFVNTEEVLADTIHRQTPGATIHGYSLFPNRAFEHRTDEHTRLWGFNSEGEFGLHNLPALSNTDWSQYSAINVGPITAGTIAGGILQLRGVDYVGPRENELQYELDKTEIANVFPESSGILPPTRIVESADDASVAKAKTELGGNVVIKFVGDYTKYYDDAETGRVRMPDGFANEDERRQFMQNSINESGKVVLQKEVIGTQFSCTVVIDGNGSIFRLGENICYKHRNDGENGPLTDGTGSVSIDNTVPALSPEDITRIEEEIIRPYVTYLGDKLGRQPKTFLNIDLIKDSMTGKVHLLEVNNRQPGGHTMAGLLSGLDTPLFEVLQAAQEGRLMDVERKIKLGAGVVVSAYPSNFPYPFEDPDHRPTLRLPIAGRGDGDSVLYTGWVDVLEEDEGAGMALVQPYSAPSVLVSSHKPTLAAARRAVYEKLKEIVPSDGFDYRRDIGRFKN